MFKILDKTITFFERSIHFMKIMTKIKIKTKIKTEFKTKTKIKTEFKTKIKIKVKNQINDLTKLNIPPYTLNIIP
jgi:hypothetical protein